MIDVLTGIGSSLREAFFMFWETLWALILGFGISGAVQAFISRGQMERVLGRGDAATLTRATFLGMVSSSCSYAASAMAKSLFAKGADFSAALVFMIASTNLVVELGIVLALLIGWQFTASEFVGGFLMIAMFGVLARFAFPARVVNAARDRLRQGDPPPTASGDAAQPAESNAEAGRRLRSLAGWADSASYTIADMTMLRREMLVGFGIAGFLAVLVPNSVWSHAFITGNGFWTSLENVVVGPFIAIISFVCSIGNVPLAAALWKGGISFGGVVSFVFADLITLPLLAIYRKYYGTRLALRMLVTLWLVMAAAGLAVEYLFGALGWVPATRPREIAPTHFSLDYTTVLNVIFLVALAGLYYLHRNRVRFGGGAGYAIDPVCGMQVEVATAPAAAVYGGAVHHFCSDHCRERFEGAPDRFGGGTGAGAELAGTADHNGESVVDPVCGMTVDPGSAAAHRDLAGRRFSFCGAGCAAAFDADPERFLATATR